MTILEPTTVATDYLLAVLGLALGWRLWRRPRLDNGSRRLWAGMFLAMAVAAFAGGTSHGWADRLSEGGYWALWRATVWSIGIASLCAGSAMARFAFRRSVARWWVALFGLQFLVYAIWMTTHDDFEYVILEYAPAMLFVAVVSAWRWLGHGWRGGSWVVVGVLVSFAAAGVQVSGLSLHRHFNHNDLYHVIQMLGFYLLYRGGDMLADLRAA
jgi:hypothetical protein